MVLKDKVMEIFKEISSIPRCSGNEIKISQYLMDYANKHNWQAFQDEVLNVIIKVEGKNELKNAKTVILQGHMDMVCVKEQSSTHDFFRDPLDLYEDSGWLRAKGTTLGADNGIALAIALAIASDKNISHPPLELLFTVDEERGLTGANNLKPGLLKGQILLNIDSEDEGVFTIGCAGGRDTHIELPLNYEQNTKKMPTFKLIIENLSGGHSGIQINQPKANAIQLATRLLNVLLKNIQDFHLCDIKGGIAHNAIPREIVVEFCGSDEEKIKNICEEYFIIFKNEYSDFEPDMKFSLSKIEMAKALISSKVSNSIINLLFALPHGVFTMSQNMKDLVETSNNLAQVHILNNNLQILLSQRSSVGSRLDYLTQKIESVAKLAGAKVKSGNGYPAWEPNWNSELLKKTKLAYKNIFNKEPKIEVIHAGLECGVIGAKYPGMDMISFGPTILSPHSPEEKLKIEDIEKILKFLFELFTIL